MDASRFDALAKAVATRRSTRRGVLALLGGGLVAGFGAVLGWPQPDARGQTAPTPAPAPPASGPKPCASDADCGGAPWACLGTGHGAYCFDTSSDATHCGPNRLNCSDQGQVCCNGRCTILKDNRNHCGSCDNICDVGKTCCGAECAYLDSNSNHCGQCGNACPRGDCCNGVCLNDYLKQDPKNCGTCGNVCDPETPICCNGRCSGLQTPVNCGACGVRCHENEVCCPTGKRKAECADFQTHPRHCGDCLSPCKANEACCNGHCHDVQSDLQNCGECGLVCRPQPPPGPGTPVVITHVLVADAGDLCCHGKCTESQFDPANCGACDHACGEGETCCFGVCVNLLTDHGDCGGCGEQCPEHEICVNGFCVKETGAAGPPEEIDLAAAATQTTDSALAGDWQIARAEETEDLSQLESLAPDLAEVLARASGVIRAAVLTLLSTSDDGQVDGILKTVLVELDNADDAREAFDDYQSNTADGVEEDTDAEAELGEADDKRFGSDTNPDDPDVLDVLPDQPTYEFIYREGAIIGSQYARGLTSSVAVDAAKGLIDRLRTGTVDGRGLAGQLVFADGVSPVLDVWYSRLDGASQRRLGASDDQFAVQQATDGDATDFARSSQVIPTTDASTILRLSTWAARFKNSDAAQSWLDGTSQRLANQSPDVQLTSIDEADGLGDASTGLLYTLSRPEGVALGVDLYVRNRATVFTTGLSASGPQMTPGLSALFADARPLGKGAQVVIGAQLAALPKENPANPRGVSHSEIFAGLPFDVAANVNRPGATATFTPEQAATATNVPENTATATEDTSSAASSVAMPSLPDLPYATPFPGRDVSSDYQVAGGTFCFGLDVCKRVGRLTDPYAGWVPPDATFLLYNQTLQLPTAAGAQPPQSVITTNVFWFDTSANARQARTNWITRYGGAQPIDTNAKGWNLYGFSGTQNGGPFDAVAGLYATSNYFLTVQQTNYGSTVDRDVWTKLPNRLTGYLKATRTGKAPNLAAYALNLFADANTAGAYFGSYFGIDGATARAAGQTDDQFAQQLKRNGHLAYGYLGGFVSRDGSTAATTVRTFKAAADVEAFFRLATGSDRQDAIKAGFVPVPLNAMTFPQDGITVDPFFGIDKNGAPGITIDIDDPTRTSALVLSLDDGVVKVPAGGTVTDEYKTAMALTAEDWVGAFDAVLQNLEKKLTKKPSAPPPLSLADDLEALEDACKTDPNRCVM